MHLHLLQYRRGHNIVLCLLFVEHIYILRSSIHIGSKYIYFPIYIYSYIFSYTYVQPAKVVL